MGVVMTSLSQEEAAMAAEKPPTPVVPEELKFKSYVT